MASSKRRWGAAKRRPPFRFTCMTCVADAAVIAGGAATVAAFAGASAREYAVVTACVAGGYLAALRPGGPT